RPSAPRVPYTTRFRSGGAGRRGARRERRAARQRPRAGLPARPRTRRGGGPGEGRGRRRGGGEEAAGGGALLVPRGRVRPGHEERSEEHTSELQSRENL